MRTTPGARLRAVAMAIAMVMSAGGCATNERTTAAPSTTNPASTTEPATDGIVALRDDAAIVNLRPRDTPFSRLDPWPEGIGYVRAWGGSRGMVTFPTEEAVPAVLRGATGRDAYDVVSQVEIDGLLELQRAHATRLIYLVNVNDTLEDQASFIERLTGAGLDIAALEMGNELYLEKFRSGDTGKLGVTRAWSVENYVEMLRAWGPELRRRLPKAPVYGLAASHGTSDGLGDQRRRAWNETLLAAIRAEPSLVDGVTFHHYAGVETGDQTGEEGVSNAGFAYLETFGDLPIAITESGYRFTELDSANLDSANLDSANLDSANLDSAEAFWTSLRGALKPGDVFGIHVMYNDSKRAGGVPFALFDERGRTAVGDRFAAWLETWAVDPAR